MKKGLCILSVVLAVLAVAGGIFLFHDALDTPQKLSRQFMDSLIRGDFRKVYKLTTASDTRTFEEFSEEMALESFAEEWKEAGKKADYEILLSDTSYFREGAEGETGEKIVPLDSEEGANRAQVSLTVTGEEGEYFRLTVPLVRTDDRWRIEF
jgi:hypothetical protein